MAHEDLSREEPVEGSSDRSFGFVFSVVFAIVGTMPLLHGAPPHWWACGVSAAFACIALVVPAALVTPNRLWMRLGLLLGRIVAPLTLGVLFFMVFTPVGLAMRIRGKDPLKLKREPAAESYWVRRAPPGPPPSSMTNQF